MNTKIQLNFRLKFAFTIIFVFAICHTSSGQEDSSNTIFKFKKALETVATNYVDTVNQPQLVEHAIKAMIKELDPHSVYMTKKELDKANESLYGKFIGVGITYQIIDDTIYIISTVRDGPSEKSGILAGDRIIRIDGEDTTGSKINNKYVQNKLRGKKGSKVEISVFRKSTKENLDIKIKRNEIPIYSVDAYFMLTPDIGYIKINRFAKNTMREYLE